MSKQPKIIEIRKGVMEQNDLRANALRENFKRRGIAVVNVVSSPGSGKTTLLTTLLTRLAVNGMKVCAIVGDLATDNDAKRLAESGAPVRQINTDGMCHLEASMIEKELAALPWKQSDLLFIENVGNLVCPANYDLGESARIVLLSVTEGEDKPLKYPTMFSSADLCLITKTDLADAAEFNYETAEANIKAVNPDINILRVSTKKNKGLDEVVGWLEKLRKE